MLAQCRHTISPAHVRQARGLASECPQLSPLPAYKTSPLGINSLMGSVPSGITSGVRGWNKSVLASKYTTPRYVCSSFGSNTKCCNVWCAYNTFSHQLNWIPWVMLHARLMIRHKFRRYFWSIIKTLEKVNVLHTLVIYLPFQSENAPNSIYVYSGRLQMPHTYIIITPTYDINPKWNIKADLILIPYIINLILHQLKYYT